MQFVWTLTVAYSGPLGLAVYAWAGWKQIARDSVWQRGARPIAHCYSGCGAGEATISEPLFRSALAFSLTMGLLVAYPVNVTPPQPRRQRRHGQAP